jgi:uncharacterized membrane protein HdeD (DUF308 family)
MTADVPTIDRPARTVREAWSVVLALGIVTAGCGLVLTFWPEATLRILALIVAVQLLLTGLAGIVGAVAGGNVDRGVRALVVLSGILSVLLGRCSCVPPSRRWRSWDSSWVSGGCSRASSSW